MIAKIENARTRTHMFLQFNMQQQRFVYIANLLSQSPTSPLFVYTGDSMEDIDNIVSTMIPYDPTRARYTYYDKPMGYSQRKEITTPLLDSNTTEIYLYVTPLPHRHEKIE